MPEVLEQIDLGYKNTANREVAQDPWIPRSVRKKGYITSNNDPPQQLNEDASCTQGNRRRLEIIISITADFVGEFDLAPELTIKEAANIAKKFFKSPPSDIIDSDLDSGF